ncbi:MAG: SGNH/GDSL hydrolase family protein [Planctomycetes bacterium]|nr:SGNH/GDSL hydrolase family protein [Planctomycetota bacterium]
MRFHRVRSLEPREGLGAEGAAPEGPEAENPQDPRRWRYHLTEEEADRCFAFLGDPRRTYDPWVYCRDAGNLDDAFPRPEHPNRRFHWRTNSLGFREDHELDDPPRDLRVLVAGDSHTFGLCDNAESFSNLLEESLARARPGRTVEVLNAGYGGYSFHNYLGTLLRLRSFAPQVAVVVVFGGNDFAELALLEAQFSGRPLPLRGPRESERLNAALALSPDALGQGLNAADVVRCAPELQPLLVDRAVELCAEMQRVARAGGTQLIVAFLPSPFDFPWPNMPKRAVDARVALELADQELEANQRMGREFLDGLRGAGVTALDLHPVLEREPSPPFWRIDYHLDLRGHQLVAQALEPLVLDRLAEH